MSRVQRFGVSPPLPSLRRGYVLLFKSLPLFNLGSIAVDGQNKSWANNEACLGEPKLMWTEWFLMCAWAAAPVLKLCTGVLDGKRLSSGEHGEDFGDHRHCFFVLVS